MNSRILRWDFQESREEFFQNHQRNWFRILKGFPQNPFWFFLLNFERGSAVILILISLKPERDSHEPWDSLAVLALERDFSIILKQISSESWEESARNHRSDFLNPWDELSWNLRMNPERNSMIQREPWKGLAKISEGARIFIHNPDRTLIGNSSLGSWSGFLQNLDEDFPRILRVILPETLKFCSEPWKGFH